MQNGHHASDVATRLLNVLRILYLRDCMRNLQLVQISLFSLNALLQVCYGELLNLYMKIYTVA